MQGKARQSKAKQDKARQSKAKPGKARQSKAKQDMARQSEAKQGKARESKAKQGEARQSKARQGKAKQGKARQSKATVLALSSPRAGAPRCKKRMENKCWGFLGRSGVSWLADAQGYKMRGNPANLCVFPYVDARGAARKTLSSITANGI